MHITSANRGDILCLYQTGQYIKILDVDTKTFSYMHETGERFVSQAHYADAIVEQNESRRSAFNLNCNLGRVLFSAESKAMQIIQLSAAASDPELIAAKETLSSVRRQMRHLAHRLREEHRSAIPGKAMASAFLNLLYEQGTGSHDTFWGHRVENTSQMTGTFSIDGRIFGYADAVSFLSQVRYKTPARPGTTLSAQIAGAKHRKVTIAKQAPLAHPQDFQL